MSLLSFLTSAIGGTLIGGVTQILGTAVGELRDWSASKRKIAEITAMKEKQIAIGELDAFSKAVAGAVTSSYTPPPTAPSWMHALFTIAAFVTNMVRPAMVIWACWYIYTLPAAVAAPLQQEIVAFSFAVGYFWLGIRHQHRSSGK